jgi:hypothetical protein
VCMNYPHTCEISLCVYIYIHTHVYLSMYIHIYTYTHILKNSWIFTASVPIHRILSCNTSLFLLL